MFATHLRSTSVRGILKEVAKPAELVGVAPATGLGVPVRLSCDQPASFATGFLDGVDAPVCSRFPECVPARPQPDRRTWAALYGLAERPALASVVLYLRGATAGEADTDRCRLLAAELGLSIASCQRSSLVAAGLDRGLTRVRLAVERRQVAGLVTWRRMLDGRSAWCAAFTAAGGGIFFLDSPVLDVPELAVSGLPRTALLGGEPWVTNRTGNWSTRVTG